MWIRSLADADASCGAKAAGLARLIAAGLRVPDGFVLDHRAFHHIAQLGDAQPDAVGHAIALAERRIASAALPPELERELADRAARLGRLAVRSSAAIEDGALGSGAGVFASLTDIAPDQVWDAVRAVWASALTPLAIRYAQRRAAAIAISVIVQRFIPGERVTVYTRPVGSLRAAQGPASAGDERSAPGGDDLWLSRQGQLERVPRAQASRRPETVSALAAEAAIAATRGADVELVIEPASDPHAEVRPWIVQARPIIDPPRRRRSPPPPALLASLVQDGRRWTWDVSHNPDPLSPAQAGLVEQVDRAAVAPYALRVCAGYLYTTPRAPREPPAPRDPPTTSAELAEQIAAIEARFALDERDAPPPAPAVAVERYVAFMQIWACELSPLVASARRRLLDRLARDGHPPERIPALAAALIGPRRVLRDPVMSPAWDVAVATLAERAQQRAPSERDPRDRRDPREPSGSPGAAPVARPPVAPELAAEVELARAAADAAETDDIWFARAQWMVRRALLAHGASLALHGDDILWLPLDEAITPRTLDRDEVHRRASAARAAHARAATWDMPLQIPADEIREPSGAASGPAARDPALTLHGVGLGPRVVGRVVRLASLGASATIGRGDVIVTRAITPALAMLVEGCAALVSETGGLLDHGAALARELGITCVVGCSGAWAQLVDGAVISVDGDAGLVELA
jgi:pyruvate,water dikinase